MMDKLLTTYVDGSFLDSVAALFPAVGAGVILGLIFIVFGWLFGLLTDIFHYE